MKDKLNATQQHISLLGTASTVDSKKGIKSPKRISYDKPTPLDFDAFIPWVCLEWQSPETVVVTRTVQDDYLKQDNRRSTSSRTKLSKSLKFKHDDEIETKKSAITIETSGKTEAVTRNSDVSCAVPVKSHYDNKGRLVEISITKCPIKIHRKVIQAFSICLPFHPLLTKLTIRRGGVTASLIREIGKMLPHSNLTDVCLDDCILPDGNYEVLLDQMSPLKYLSLNRCSIDDTKCKSIAAKIDIGSSGSSLLVLELGSNLISDHGAKAIGESLRRNRHLLHLNLSGNIISDEGAVSILSVFMEFRMMWDEIFNARQRKLKYTEKKLEVYASFYAEAFTRQRADLLTLSNTSKRSTSKVKNSKILKEEKYKRNKRSRSVIVEIRSAVDIAAAMTMDAVGEFTDPYDETNVIQKNESSYSKGNMVLCSLNLAYNNLSFLSIKKLYEVLNYQDKMAKPPGATGLLRVVFDGNSLPNRCVLYDRIEMLLKKVVLENTTTIPVSNTNNIKKRTLSGGPSKRSFK